MQYELPRLSSFLCGTYVAALDFMIVALSIVGVVAAGLIAGYVLTTTAPYGYEDETGFHLGRQEGDIQEELLHGAPEPKAV